MAAYIARNIEQAAIVNIPKRLQKRKKQAFIADFCHKSYRIRISKT